MALDWSSSRFLSHFLIYCINISLAIVDRCTFVNKTIAKLTGVPQRQSIDLLMIAEKIDDKILLYIDRLAWHP